MLLIVSHTPKVFSRIGKKAVHSATFGITYLTGILFAHLQQILFHDHIRSSQSTLHLKKIVEMLRRLPGAIIEGWCLGVAPAP